jgi:hypothetical protein
MATHFTFKTTRRTQIWQSKHSWPTISTSTLVAFSPESLSFVARLGLDGVVDEV